MTLSPRARCNQVESQRRRAVRCFEPGACALPRAPGDACPAPVRCPLLTAKRLPATSEKDPCYGRKSSLLWEAKIPCYFSAHGTRRTAFVCQAWPAALGNWPFSPFGRLPQQGVLILVFSKAWSVLISDSTRFFFPESRFVLECPKSGAGGLSNWRRFRGRQKIRLCCFASENSHPYREMCFLRRRLRREKASDRQVAIRRPKSG